MFKKTPYKTRWYHRKPSSFFYRYQVQDEGKLDEMDLIRFDVEPGYEPNSKPPVRIYLGTQDEQHRAERIFIWSVKKHRDPSRVYEIYLMSSIKGIHRRGWKTGFSLYRYAIPELAGVKGKAIYNDVDQIYLTDPAELFDTEMGDAGVMAIDEKENSVMLIDCEKMVKIWNIEKLNEGMRHKYFRAKAVEEGLWAKMDGVWNTRDSEWPIEKTKCLHYTTLQTQPWKPFPKALRYRPNPVGYVWFDMEKEADEAGFMVFTKKKPSRRFLELVAQYQQMHDATTKNKKTGVGSFRGSQLMKSATVISKLIAETGAQTILDYGSGKGDSYQPYPGESADSRIKKTDALGDVKVICYDPGHKPFSEPYSEKTDGVICIDVVEHIPASDIPWVLDEMFSTANKFVYVNAANYLAKAVLPNGENAHCTVHDEYWWSNQMEQAARKRPQVSWVLGLDSRRKPGNKKYRTYTHSS